MGLEVVSTSQRASFPFGAQLSGVRLISTRPTSAGLLVESPAVTIAPAFLSMLTMHPGVRVKAALYDGVVNVTIRPSGGGTAISYDLDSIELARQQLWTIPGASAAGALSGSGNLLLSPDDIAETGAGDIERSRTDLHLGARVVANPSRRRPFKIQTGSGHADDRATNNQRRRLDAHRRRNRSTRARPRPIASSRSNSPSRPLPPPPRSWECCSQSCRIPRAPSPIT